MSDPMDQELEAALARQRALEEKILGRFEASESVEVPEALQHRAKRLLPGRSDLSCPHCGKGITPFKKSLGSQKGMSVLWFALAVSAFALSFFVKPYFLQCVAVGILFGLKWVLAGRAARTQVLIYKALKEDQSLPSRQPHDLHDSHSRL